MRQGIEPRHNLAGSSLDEVPGNRVATDVHRVHESIDEQHARAIAPCPGQLSHELRECRAGVDPEQILVLEAGVVLASADSPATPAAARLGRSRLPNPPHLELSPALNARHPRIADQEHVSTPCVESRRDLLEQLPVLYPERIPTVQLLEPAHGHLRRKADPHPTNVTIRSAAPIV